MRHKIVLTIESDLAAETLVGDLRTILGHRSCYNTETKETERILLTEFGEKCLTRLQDANVHLVEYSDWRKPLSEVAKLADEIYCKGHDAACRAFSQGQFCENVMEDALNNAEQRAFATIAEMATKEGYTPEQVDKAMKDLWHEQMMQQSG